MKRSRALRITVRIAGAMVTVLITVALVRALRRDGPAAWAAWQSADVLAGWLTLSVVGALTGQVFLILGWRRLLADCGVRATTRQTARLFLVSNLGRYLPAAKAWQMGILGLMAVEGGLPPGLVATSSLFHGLVGVGVGALLLLATGGAALGAHPLWLLAPVLGVIGLLLAPRAMRAVPAIRSFVEVRLPGLTALDARTMWALVWTCAASWTAWGAALFCLATSLLGDPGSTLSHYVAAWTGPLLAGVASIVAPAGLGVREEVMRTMLVTSGVPAGGAVVLVVVARVWATALEVIPAAWCLVGRRWRSTATADTIGQPPVDVRSDLGLSGRPEPER